MAGKNNNSFDQLMQDLKNQIYYPVYLLHGEESYFIDEISAYIEKNLLNEQEKEFNQTIVYGKDSNISTLIGYAKRFPMMANYQVLIIKEAQELDKLEDFQPYVENPLKSTILVICYISVINMASWINGRGFLKPLKKTGSPLSLHGFMTIKFPTGSMNI